MPSFAQALDLKDDPALIAAYKAHHRAVWPEVLAALRAIGITQMRIYLLGTHLFMHFEAIDGFDPARDFQKFTLHPRGQEWDTLMRTFQQRVRESGGVGPSDWWTPMELVFDLDWRNVKDA